MGYCYWIRQEHGLSAPKITDKERKLLRTWPRTKLSSWCSHSPPWSNLLLDLMGLRAPGTARPRTELTRACNRLLPRESYVVPLYFKMPLLTENYFSCFPVVSSSKGKCLVLAINNLRRCFIDALICYLVSLTQGGWLHLGTAQSLWRRPAVGTHSTIISAHLSFLRMSKVVKWE